MEDNPQAATWRRLGGQPAASWRGLGADLAVGSTAGAPSAKVNAVRKAALQHAAMSDEPSPLNLRQRRILRYRRHGHIYNWLRAHHDAISPLFADETATWPVVCREMQRQGVTSRDGAPPSPSAASKAWQVVVRDVADEAKKSDDATGRVGGTPPSHRPKHDRRPEPAPASRSTAEDAAGNRAVAVVSRSGTLATTEPYSGPTSTHAEKMALLNGEATVAADHDPNSPAEIEYLLGRINVRSGLPWNYRKPGN